MAQKLSPVEYYAEVDKYVPRECASAYSITKKDIKDYRKSRHCSLREAKGALVKECKHRNLVRIVNSLSKNKIVIERVYSDGEDTIVETRLKVLVHEDLLKSEKENKEVADMHD